MNDIPPLTPEEFVALNFMLEGTIDEEPKVLAAEDAAIKGTRRRAQEAPRGEADAERWSRALRTVDGFAHRRVTYTSPAFSETLDYAVSTPR